MFKLYCLISLLLPLSLCSSYSQSLVSTQVLARNVVLEQFTGINIPNAPAANLIAEKIMTGWPDNTVLIFMHQGDYSAPNDSTQLELRTKWGDSIANLAAVMNWPKSSINRHSFPEIVMDSNTGISRSYWEDAARSLRKLKAPVNVGIASNFDSLKRELTIQVELYYTDNSASSTNWLNVCLIENNIIGYQANGGNKYVHNHVLRDYLSGQWGDQIIKTTKGTLQTKTYKYSVPANFNINNCEVVAFVSQTRKEILNGFKVAANGGTTLPIASMRDLSNQNYITPGLAETKTINLRVKNLLNIDEKFRFTMNSNAMPNWTILFKINGTDYKLYDTAYTTIKKGDSIDISLSVTPKTGTSVVISTLKMESLSFPNSFPQYYNFYTISNVHNLIINNINLLGDGSTDNASKFQDSYTNAFANNSIAKTTTIMSDIYEKIALDSIPLGIKNIYYNIGWTFPAISDNLCGIFSKFLDAGGNLFICGQDFAWDCSDTSVNAHRNPINFAFYDKYMASNFVHDGDTALKFVYGNQYGPIYKNIGNCKMVNAYGKDKYGKLFYFPELVSPKKNGSSILYYDGDTSKCGGILTTNGSYKIVYLGVSLEMFSSTSMKDAIILLTSLWFDGVITEVEYQNEMKSLTLGSNSPNPANDETIIPLDNIKYNSTLEIIDLSGSILKAIDVPPASDQLKINTSEFKNGVYFYRLKCGKNSTEYKKMIVLKR
ncbi:MAG: Omp28-related outer membrane protein [Candidatus Kapabacteria bacterium]|nr:Omp28-related outer membrane protein [Candidatus Kapabacteria bacterium]